MLLHAESIDYYSVKLPNGLLFAAIVYNMKKNILQKIALKVNTGKKMLMRNTKKRAVQSKYSDWCGKTLPMCFFFCTMLSEHIHLNPFRWRHSCRMLCHSDIWHGFCKTTSISDIVFVNAMRCYVFFPFIHLFWCSMVLMGFFFLYRNKTLTKQRNSVVKLCQQHSI